MLKLKLLLWVLGFLLKRTWRSSESFRAEIAKTPLNFAVKTADKKLDHGFLLQATGVTTQKNSTQTMDMTLVFGTADKAWRTFTSKDKNAFMRAIQEGEVKVEGDYKQLFQLQKLVKHLNFKR